MSDASQRSKPRGAEKVPTPLQRKDRRIAELENEIDEARARVRHLERGRDNPSEGPDCTWNDKPEDRARVVLQLQPLKAKRVASKILELSKSTAPPRCKWQAEPRSERRWDTEGAP